MNTAALRRFTPPIFRRLRRIRAADDDDYAVIFCHRLYHRYFFTPSLRHYYAFLLTLILVTITFFFATPLLPLRHYADARVSSPPPALRHAAATPLILIHADASDYAAVTAAIFSWR